MEDRKFYAYYHAKKWRLQGGLNITNWKETAKNFVEKGYQINQESTRPITGYMYNLKSIVDKN